jgi:hypothetical protein
MRDLTAIVGTLMAIWGSVATAQTRCDVSTSPPYGPTGFTGSAPYQFDYWSHTKNVNGENLFQLGVKNAGPTPITVDWPDAGYFRRGIPSGASAPGACESDRNPLNTTSGRIRYGPNANFDGPVARFYTRPGVAVSTGGVKNSPTTFYVEWESVLESGQKYLAAVEVRTAVVEGNSIRYTFTSKGRPVELEWAGVLTDAALAAATRQAEGLVRGSRLVLRTFAPAQFTVTGECCRVEAITAPLSIFDPDGLLLYRDNHRGLAVVR